MAEPWARAPVIVLTYAHAGARQMQALLSAHTELACTTGTGLLPLCDHAARVWRHLEPAGDGRSGLAASSIRALVAPAAATLLPG
jgi:hypothetical protein